MNRELSPTPQALLPTPNTQLRARNQPVLFQRLRWHLLRNSTATVLQTSPVRLITILACSLLVWAGVFAASRWGFRDLQAQGIPFAGGIVGTLFDLLFLAMATMLIFSTGIILYSSLFSSAETAFLLSLPASADQVFAYKYQGAISFSSWAFVLLGSPSLVAYGWMFSVPWYFYALLPLYFLAFVLLPGSLGAILCMLVVNFLPRKPKQVLAIAVLAVLSVGTIWIVQVWHTAGEALRDQDALRDLFGQLTIAQGPLVPSHWMARGLESAARGDVAGALYPLALLWSNGLFFYVVAAWSSARLFRRGYNRLATGGSLRKRYGGLWLDRIVRSLVPFVHSQTRLLVVKDFRTFRRDPAQWAQVLIFMGLLAFFAANTRRFYTEEIGRIPRNSVSLLNVTATAFLLCAYTGRFIYPMLSLEGRKFWVLGLLPLRRERLLWGKFAFSATGALITAELLVVFSDLVLGMSIQSISLHALSVIVLAVGLSGLSVGLGACMPNFRESDPSKIAVGFGGTLNLVISLLFILVVIACMDVPYHFYAAAASDDDARLSGWWLAAGVAAGIGVGVAAVAVPLRMGARALRRMEF
jgi:ABC-2 type transport system permease protein